MAYNPGVADPVVGRVGKGIRDLGIATVRSVETAREYSLRGGLLERDVQSICDKLLVNGLIQLSYSLFVNIGGRAKQPGKPFLHIVS